MGSYIVRYYVLNGHANSSDWSTTQYVIPTEKVIKVSDKFACFSKKAIQVERNFCRFHHYNS